MSFWEVTSIVIIGVALGIVIWVVWTRRRDAKDDESQGAPMRTPEEREP